MAWVDTIIISVITAVVSSIVIEWVRETRRKGRQFLERIADVVRRIGQIRRKAR